MITVITPSYNSAQYIERCLRSVLEQGHHVSRHIVMDGGSDDGTVDILKAYEQRYNLDWRSEPDRGQSDALQKALALVDTPYFYWLNADDCLMDGALQRLQESPQFQAPGVAILYGDYLLIDGDDRIIGFRRQPTFSFWDCLYGYLTVQNCAAIFNTELAKQAGGFDVNLRFVMDYDLILKLGKLGSVQHIPEYLGAFRRHASSKTSTLQTVCEQETIELRQRYSQASLGRLKCNYFVAKAKVAFRMIAQGCLWSRMQKPHGTIMTWPG